MQRPRRTQSTISRARPSLAISTPRRRASPSRRVVTRGICPLRWSIRRTSDIGASSTTGATGTPLGTITRPTSCATSRLSCASVGAIAHRSSSSSFLRAGVPPPGISGRKWWDGIRDNFASSATCRTHGSNPISSARCSICSPTSATPMARSCSARASRPSGSTAAASRSRACARPTARCRIRFGGRARVPSFTSLREHGFRRAGLSSSGPRRKCRVRRG